ncbi:MAG: carbon storage regulator [Planctomycetota bacterium]
MLVITRREGEEVVIGSPDAPIGVVRIASIKGDRVRVAFEFPRDVAVHRREVADQIVADAAPGRTGDAAPGRTTDEDRPSGTAGRNAESKSARMNSVTAE